jgi:hypothetical protein
MEKGLTSPSYGAGPGGVGGLITSSTPGTGTAIPGIGGFGVQPGGTKATEAQLTAQYGAMTDIVRKATAQKLKSAGYKVPVTGRYNAAVREAFLDASRRFSDEINTLIRNDPQRLNTGKFDLDTYLADLAFTRAGTGTGDEVPKPYIQERQSTKASIRKGAIAAAETLLGRGLSEEQLNEIYKKAIKREEAMPVVTKYAKAKGGGIKATTTGGADTEEFLYQEIAKTDEAKQNKIFGLYDAFKTAIGVK